MHTKLKLRIYLKIDYPSQDQEFKYSLAMNTTKNYTTHKLASHKTIKFFNALYAREILIINSKYKHNSASHNTYNFKLIPNPVIIIIIYYNNSKN